MGVRVERFRGPKAMICEVFLRDATLGSKPNGLGTVNLASRGFSGFRV